MRFNLQILENNKEIQNKILDSMLNPINKIISRGISKIKNNLPGVIQTAIINSPEYESLLSGKLQYELGVNDINVKLTNLLNVWTTNIIYDYQQPSITNNRISCRFSAKMIRADFSDVLYADFASVQDTLRGYSLPWLQWLLLEGNKTIIKNHEVVFGPNRASRTGFAIMKPSNRSWRVPPEFAGTQTNNWITRAIDSASPQIYSILEEAFK